jgi:hypothetical protein
MPSMSSILSELRDVGITPQVIDRAVGESLVVRTAVIQKTQAVADYWRSIAPVSTRGSHPLGKGHEGYVDVPGDYQRSITVTYEEKTSGYFEGRVETKDPKAHWLEYGSIHNPEYGYAQRVVEYFGGTSTEGGGFNGVVS